MKKSILLITLLTLFFGNTQAQNWNEIIKIVASDRDTADEFGYSVAISGNYAIVGADEEDEDVEVVDIREQINELEKQMNSGDKDE